MDSNISQQIFETINRSQKILITLPQTPSADAVAGGLALFLFLERLEKDVEIVAPTLPAENIKFLPGIEKIKNQLPGGRSLVIRVDASKKKLGEISYQKSENHVEIFIKAKGEDLFNEHDIELSTDKFPVDLIIAVGAKSLDSFGKLFEDNAGLFFETPKINIDSQPSNEYYGSVNLVDLSATGVSEVVSGLLEEFETEMIDEDIATCLLTGIITQTNSFQHVLTTPKAFEKASQLISLGGRQQEIIRHVYKTKSLSQLRLWGKALAKLKADEERSLVYSVLTEQDFKETGAKEPDAVLVLKDLLDAMSFYKLVAIIASPAAGKTNLFLAVHPEIQESQLLEQLGGEVKYMDFNFGQHKVMTAEFESALPADLEKKLLGIKRNQA